MKVEKYVTKARTIRFEPDLWDRVRAEAKTKNMTSNRFIKAVLISYFEELDNAKTIKE